MQAGTTKENPLDEAKEFINYIISYSLQDPKEAVMLGSIKEKGILVEIQGTLHFGGICTGIQEVCESVKITAMKGKSHIKRTWTTGENPMSY